MTTHTIPAYRLGHLPGQEEVSSRDMGGPAISFSEASRLMLPTGSFFEVSEGALLLWLDRLMMQARLPADDLEFHRTGLNLGEDTDRWYLLACLCEKRRFKALITGKEVPIYRDKTSAPGHPISGYPELLELVKSYGLSISRSRRVRDMQLHAYKLVPSRKRIYLGTERRLLADQLMREDVIARLERKGMRRISSDGA